MAAINISVLSGCGARGAIAAGGEGRSEDSSQKCLFSPQDWRDRCLVLQRMWAVFQKPQPRRLPVQPHNQLCCPDGHFETRGGWCQACGFRGLWFSKTLIQSLSSEGDSQHCQQMDPMLQHVRTMLPLVWQRLPLGLLRGASYLAGARHSWQCRTEPGCAAEQGARQGLQTHGSRGITWYGVHLELH